MCKIGSKIQFQKCNCVFFFIKSWSLILSWRTLNSSRNTCCAAAVSICCNFGCLREIQLLPHLHSSIHYSSITIQFGPLCQLNPYAIRSVHLTFSNNPWLKIISAFLHRFDLLIWLIKHHKMFSWNNIYFFLVSSLSKIRFIYLFRLYAMFFLYARSKYDWISFLFL